MRTSLFLLLLLLLPSLGAAQQRPVALVDVTVIDMTGAPARPGSTLVISEGRILALGVSHTVSVPENAHRIDGTGKYVIPGLWDMHVHVFFGGAEERLFPLLVANGVTSVRDMNGPVSLEAIHDLRSRVASGETLGPRILAPGPLIDGPGRPASALGPNVIDVATPEEARTAVTTLAERGADFIKVYNRTTLELLQAVSEGAGEVGLKVVGHVPDLIGASMAARAGLRSIEHLDGVLEAASREGASLERLLRGVFEADQDGTPPSSEQLARYREIQAGLASGYDEELASHLYEVFVQQGTWQTPTLVSNRGLYLGPIDPGMAHDDRLAYVPENVSASWFPATLRLPLGSAKAHRERFEVLGRVVADMHRAGVRMLAGTDLGVAHVFAGFSLHDELELLVQNGLTPEDALLTATRNPAEFEGMLDQLGTIEVNKFADLVLLDANPLEHIGNTRRIAGVFLAGRWLDRWELDGLLETAMASADGGK
jgi:imidazolonepropionase-like amidohydrolase